jgi:flagellar hook-basal body complex protein FliE
MQAISAISIPPLAPQISTLGAVQGGTASAHGVSFKQVLLDAIEQLGSTSTPAAMAPEAPVQNAAEERGGALAALDRGGLSLRSMGEIRDRVLGAYREIQDMRM